MKREYFCANCGLFHWVDYYTIGESGMTHRRLHDKCPNEECGHSFEESPSYLFPVDSTAYAYFSISNSDEIKSVAWTSAKYTPEHLIENYRSQGVLIK